VRACWALPRLTQNVAASSAVRGTDIRFIIQTSDNEIAGLYPTGSATGATKREYGAVQKANGPCSRTEQRNSQFAMKRTVIAVVEGVPLDGKNREHREMANGADERHQPRWAATAAWARSSSRSPAIATAAAALCRRAASITARSRISSAAMA